MGKVISSLLYALGVLLYWLQLHHLVIWWNRCNPKVLLYHACEETESNYLRGLRCNTTPNIFAKQLDYLQHNYEIVHLAALQDGTPPDRAVVITFDDGYRSIYENAFPALRSRGLPATVYLVTNVVGNHELVWVNELNWFLWQHGPISRPIATRTYGLSEYCSSATIIEEAQVRYNTTQIRSLLRELQRLVGVDAKKICKRTRWYLDWQQIDEMRRHGITFGNHTASHPNLAAVSEQEQRNEIEGARDVLLFRLGISESCAFPFGKYNETTVKIAKAAGHRCLLKLGGLNAPYDPYRLARTTVFATTNAGLFSQMEIIEPIKSYVRKVIHRGLNIMPDCVKYSI